MIPEAPKFIKIIKIMIGIRYFFFSIFAKNTAYSITKINAGGNNLSGLVTCAKIDMIEK
tara:strand:+ start:411 stop:587 length:177 start_codon:yes stop_codon:yes gene_type:complete